MVKRVNCSTQQSESATIPELDGLRTVSGAGLDAVQTRSGLNAANADRAGQSVRIVAGDFRYHCFNKRCTMKRHYAAIYTMGIMLCCAWWPALCVRFGSTTLRVQAEAEEVSAVLTLEVDRSDDSGACQAVYGCCQRLQPAWGSDQGQQQRWFDDCAETCGLRTDNRQNRHG